MRICVLVPVHNEGKALGGLVRALREKGLEVVVVDDGSTDGSGRIAKENGAHVLRNQNKNGKGFSLQRGFQYLFNQGYDGVIMMDGDGQHTVDDIDQFVKYAHTHPHGILNGNRMANSKGMPVVRYLTNRIMSMMISLVCRQNVPDTQCGFRYVSCDILKNLDIACKDYEIETEILIKASKKGYRIDSASIKTIYQDEESHINPVKDTLRFLKFYVREIFRSGK